MLLKFKRCLFELQEMSLRCVLLFQPGLVNQLQRIFLWRVTLRGVFVSPSSLRKLQRVGDELDSLEPTSWQFASRV